MSTFFNTSLENIQQQSLLGTTSWTSLDALPSPELNQFNALPNPNKVTPSDGQGAFGAAFDNALRTTSSTVLNYISLNTNVDPKYDPFTDAQLASKGPEFVAKYGESFINSPNSYHTTRLLDKISQQEENDKLFAAAPISSILGSILGSVGDPSTLLFFTGLGPKSTLIDKVLANSASTAVFTGAFVGAQSTYDPTVTKDDVAISTAFGAGLGATFGLFGGLLDKKSSGKMIEWYKNSETATEDPITLTNLDSASAARNPIDTTDLEVAESNFAFNSLKKAASLYAPAIQLESMSTPLMKKLSQIFGSSTLITKGNLKGKTGYDSLEYNLESAMTNQVIPHEKILDSSYAEYKTKGGQLSSNEFDIQARNVAMGLDVQNPELYSKAANQMRKYLDDYTSDLKDNGLLQKDAKTSSEYMMHHTDSEKVIANYDDFTSLVKGKVSKQVRSTFDIEIETYLNDDVLKNLKERFPTVNEQTGYVSNLADEIKIKDPELYEELIQDIVNEHSDNIVNTIASRDNSLIRSSIDSFKAKSLRYRQIDFTNEEMAPYLSDDVRGTFRNYTKSIETTKELNRVIRQLKDEQTNPFESSDGVSINAVKDPYSELKAIIDNEYNPLIKSSKDKEATIKERDEASKLVKMLLDLYTGNRNPGSIIAQTKFTTPLKVLKLWNTLRVGGLFAVAQLSDLGANMSQVLVDRLQLKGKFNEIVNSMVGLSKEDAILLHTTIQDHMGNGRSVSISDLYGTDLNVKSKFDKTLNKVRDGFFHLNLMSTMMSFVRTLAVKNSLTSNLKRMELLVNNKLKVGEYDSIELASFGYGTNNLSEAKKVLEQFKKHRTEIERFGTKIYEPNLEKWEKKIGNSFMSKLMKDRNRAIVEPDIGTRPTFSYSGLGSLIAQFKGFVMSAFVKQLLRRTQAISLSDGHKQQMLASFIAHSFFGVMSGYTKDLALGRQLDISPERAVYYAFDRGGFLPMFDYLNGIGDQFGYGIGTALGAQRVSRFGSVGPLESILGPSFSILNKDLPKAISNIANGKTDPKSLKSVAKIMPLYNWLGWAWITNNIDK